MIRRILIVLLIAPFMRAMDDQNNLLITAIREGSLERTQEALESGAEVNASNNSII